MACNLYKNNAALYCVLFAFDFIFILLYFYIVFLFVVVGVVLDFSGRWPRLEPATNAII